MIIGGGFTGGSGSMHIGAELQKAGDRRGTLRRFNHFLSGYRVPITGIALLIVVEVVLTSYAPRMLQVAVDDIAAYLDGGRSLPEARRTVALAMVVALGLFAAGWGANAVARWRMVGVGQGILANIRRDVFAKVHALSLGYFDSIQAGDLMSRMANDTSVIDRVLRMGAVRMLQSFLQVGANGAGKSTCAKAILGLIDIDAGTIERAPALAVGYVPQRLAVSHTLPLTLRRLMKLTGRFPARDIDAALTAVGLERLGDPPVTSLSGGELQRLLIARALIHRPDLLVLDEPAQGVDVAGAGVLHDLIDGIRRDLGCGVLLISHDLQMVMDTDNDVIVLVPHEHDESPLAAVARG